MWTKVVTSIWDRLIALQLFLKWCSIIGIPTMHCGHLHANSKQQGEEGQHSVYSYFHIGCQFGSASPWRVSMCRWRVDGDRRLSYWLNFVAAVRKIERRLDCVNARPMFSQWERRRSPSSTWNYVSTRKQQNTLQLPTIKKIAVANEIWFRKDIIFILIHVRPCSEIKSQS